MPPKVKSTSPPIRVLRVPPVAHEGQELVAFVTRLRVPEVPEMPAADPPTTTAPLPE